MNESHRDHVTAAAFSNSWNTLPAESVYTRKQVADWLSPLTEEDVRRRSVLEMGCGNASLMLHLLAWQPKSLHGIDLGTSVQSASANLSLSGYQNWSIEQADLTIYKSKGFDLVYCIGVLHHLESPRRGFRAVIDNVKPGGRFHCWVYAKEGNRLVISLVDPIRRIASKLPWWVNKYLIATPLSLVFYCYAKTITQPSLKAFSDKMPMFEYCEWIRERKVNFFRHVVFDQLVSPQTWYIDRNTVQDWIKSNERVDQESVYIILRNGNSWKFGGRVN